MAAEAGERHVDAVLERLNAGGRRVVWRRDEAGVGPGDAHPYGGVRGSKNTLVQGLIIIIIISTY